MIRSRGKRIRRTRRATASGATRNHRDEPLRVLVRILARDAAREWFAREIEAQRQTPSEVTGQ
jgi:hypothetical protein